MREDPILKRLKMDEMPYEVVSDGIVVVYRAGEDLRSPLKLHMTYLGAPIFKSLDAWDSACASEGEGSLVFTQYFSI